MVINTIIMGVRNPAIGDSNAREREKERESERERDSREGIAQDGGMAKISYLEEKADDLVSTCALNISVPVYYTMHQHNRTLRSSGLCECRNRIGK